VEWTKVNGESRGVEFGVVTRRGAVRTLTLHVVDPIVVEGQIRQLPQRLQALTCKESKCIKSIRSVVTAHT
jgi:hypothetical protein